MDVYSVDPQDISYTRITLRLTVFFQVVIFEFTSCPKLTVDTAMSNQTDS